MVINLLLPSSGALDGLHMVQFVVFHRHSLSLIACVISGLIGFWRIIVGLRKARGWMRIAWYTFQLEILPLLSGVVCET